MTRDNFDYSHGDNGTKPDTARDFQSNQRPISEEFDWWWSTVISYINGHADEFDRLDNDDDGIVDEADDADTVDGEHATAFADAGHTHDPLNLDGSSGANGEVLKTDGTNTYWGTDKVDVSTPTGVIILWSGSISNIPSGWVLCDGNNGTPNLQDKFVVGAGGSRAAGTTGGTETVSLTESELPSHNHGDGTLGTDSHDHGDGSLDVDSHDHGNGSLDADSHDHGNGSLGADSHNHGPGDLDLTHPDFAITDQTSWGVSTSSNDVGALSSVTVGQDGTTTISEGWAGNTGSSGANVSGSTGSTGVNVHGTTSSSSPGVHGSTGSTSTGVSGNTGSAGSDNAHQNMPPFHALAYIMKT